MLVNFVLVENKKRKKTQQQGYWFDISDRVVKKEVKEPHMFVKTHGYALPSLEIPITSKLFGFDLRNFLFFGWGNVSNRVVTPRSHSQSYRRFSPKGPHMSKRGKNPFV